MLLEPPKNDLKLKLLFIFLLLADIVRTFIQNYHTMWLDGDMSALIMPADAYKRVLENPFGFNLLSNPEQYAATNRFFIHWLMPMYFKNIPFFFQNFMQPIESVFASVAFARTFFQVAMIVLLAMYSSGSRSLRNINFLIAAVILTPFFQSNGFEEQMGVTFNSITYSFFYSLPLIFLLLYFLPFYFNYVLDRKVKFHLLRNIYLFILTLFICFGGSLGSPVLLIICSLSLLYYFIFNMRINKSGSFIKSIFSSIAKIDRVLLFHFVIAIGVALYSFYIGTFNSENSWAEMPLKRRYWKLPFGLLNITTFKLGTGLMMLLILSYLFILRRKKIIDAVKYTTFIQWLAFFCVLFILMLPLGGYRAYRPLIIRNDTFTPVTISIFLAYGIAAMLMLKSFTGRNQKYLIFIYIIVAGIYMNADRYPKTLNTCQKDTLKIIAESDKEVVELTGWCDLMSWWRYKEYHESDLNAQLIQYWGITKDKKYYFHKQ